MKVLTFGTVAFMILFTVFAYADTVGQWLFDEGSGKVVLDSSGNHNDGTFVGKPEWVKDTPWKKGFALKFDGAGNYSEYIEIKDAPSLNVKAEITVEAWVKPSPGTHYGAIVCKGGEDLSKGAYTLATIDDFSFEGDLHVGGEWNWQGGGNAVPFEKDKWQHLAMVWDGKMLVEYLNGKKVHERAIKGPLDTTKDPLYIGCDGPDAGPVYTGLMDEVRISDKALSVDELGFNAPLKPSAASSLDKLAVTWGVIKQR